MNANIPPDILAAIGEPDKPRTLLNDKEIGWQMKLAAREAIDRGEIKTEEDAKQRFLVRGKWIAEAEYLEEDWREYLLKFEQSFYYSARKYLAELREIKTSFGAKK